MKDMNSNDSAMDIIAQCIEEKKVELGKAFNYDSMQSNSEIRKESKKVKL